MAKDCEGWCQPTYMPGLKMRKLLQDQCGRPLLDTYRGERGCSCYSQGSSMLWGYTKPLAGRIPSFSPTPYHASCIWAHVKYKYRGIFPQSCWRSPSWLFFLSVGLDCNYSRWMTPILWNISFHSSRLLSLYRPDDLIHSCRYQIVRLEETTDLRGKPPSGDNAQSTNQSSIPMHLDQIPVSSNCAPRLGKRNCTTSYPDLIRLLHTVAFGTRL